MALELTTERMRQGARVARRAAGPPAAGGAGAAGLAAARLILESPTIAARTRPHVSDGEVDWPALLAETATMSGGEGVLVRVAHDLVAPGGEAGVWEVAYRLGPGSFERVITALRLARGQVARATDGQAGAV